MSRYQRYVEYDHLSAGCSAQGSNIGNRVCTWCYLHQPTSTTSDSHSRGIPVKYVVMDSATWIGDTLDLVPPSRAPSPAPSNIPISRHPEYYIQDNTTVFLVGSNYSVVLGNPIDQVDRSNAAFSRCIATFWSGSQKYFEGCF